MPAIVSISGTSRPGNYTSRALSVVTRRLRELGHDVREIDARDLDLPFPGYGSTPDAEELRATVKDATAVVLATPEYHGGFCAMTKLIIENLGFPSALSGKPVALVGVAAGRIGAIKSLEQLRGVCAHVGGIVLPGAVSVAGVQNAFDDEGNPTNEQTADALRNLADALHEFVRDFVCPKHVLEDLVREDGEPWTSVV